jgi:hypothetical protein
MTTYCHDNTAQTKQLSDCRLIILQLVDPRFAAVFKSEMWQCNFTDR